MSRVEQAIILAAGRGRRMGMLTQTGPKCLLSLAGQRIIDWNLQGLRHCGITRCLLVTGWQAQALQHLDCETVPNPDWQRSNSVRSLLAADAWLRERTSLVLYGDCAYSPATLARVIEAPPCDLLVPADSQWQVVVATAF
jgi:choline kinase